MPYTMYWNSGPNANKVPTCKCKAQTVSKNNMGMMVAGFRPITMEKVSYSVSMSAERIFREISQAVMGIIFNCKIEALDSDNKCFGESVAKIRSS